MLIETKDITDRLERASYSLGDLTPDVAYDFFEFIYDYFEKLDESDKTAWYYYTVNENYFKYSETFDEGEHYEKYTEGVLDFKFGRELAYRINFPNEEFYEEVRKVLESVLLSFSDDVIDLTLIDEYTIEEIKETIVSYTH